jgi:hypothetical protein
MADLMELSSRWLIRLVAIGLTDPRSRRQQIATELEKKLQVASMLYTGISNQSTNAKDAASFLAVSQ